MTDDTILKVENLSLVFHDHDAPETVVSDFNLNLKRGEIVGLVGESGSGKSLSAMSIAGLLPRHKLSVSGSSMYKGVNLLTAPRRELRKFQGENIAVIFQNPMTSLDPVMRVGRQVEEVLRLHHPEISKEERKERAVKMLASVGLHDPHKVYSSYPHELSGGMMQRVMIAAAMIGNPEILIADEPTTALDVTVQAQIVKLLQEINAKEHTAIIFISHDLSLVRRIASRALVMQNGRVVEEGSCEDIFTSPSHEYTKKLIAAIPRVPHDIMKGGSHE